MLQKIMAQLNFIQIVKLLGFIKTQFHSMFKIILKKASSYSDNKNFYKLYVNVAYSLYYVYGLPEI